MHRRHQHLNVPTEIVRTVAVIAETGSFSKAGERLGLTQPAISAQVKRLQMLVGGPVFRKREGGGLDFTPRGRLVLTHARKLLAANDQILLLGGAVRECQPLRLGLSPLYAEPFLALWKQAGAQLPLQFYCEDAAEIAKGLAEGFLDVACFLDSQPRDDFAVSWQEDFAWARSRDFVLSPGMPVPLVSCPGSPADMPAIASLGREGLSYRVAFASADHRARIAAATAGIGLLGLPARQIGEPLIVAQEYYLPAIAPAHAGIVLRQDIGADIDAAPLQELIAALGRLAPACARASIRRPSDTMCDEQHTRKKSPVRIARAASAFAEFDTP